MNIRSITCFINAGSSAVNAGLVQSAGQLAQKVRAALRSAGFPVQTTRLATQPLSLIPGDPLRMASTLWEQCDAAGFDFLSLGPVLADGPTADLSRMDLIPELIRTTETVFAGVHIGGRGRGMHLAAMERAARLVHEIARTSELGFGNLRLAVLANVGPHAPFFPAAYHDGGSPALAIATESADLAVTAFSAAGSLEEARARLVSAVEESAWQIADLAGSLAGEAGFRFPGIDFSLAPFPEKMRSIGTAIEALGVDRFGASGTLFVSSMLTDCLRQADYPRCGFNGLMLPVLEDAILADRSHLGLFSVNDLLLYSAVCGTGLDTVPLPGDVSEVELASILLDMAALAFRLDKPLTARLMPIPGARAGDLTAFDFEYFANGRVLATKELGSRGLFQRGPWLAM